MYINLLKMVQNVIEEEIKRAQEIAWNMTKYQIEGAHVPIFLELLKLAILVDAGIELGRRLEESSSY